MKDYFKEILDLFAEHPQDKESVDAVHSWLADSSDAEEKDAAMKGLWETTSGASDIEEINRSLAAVYAKAGKKPAPSRKPLRIAFRYAAAAALLAVSVLSTWYLTKESVSTVMAEAETHSGCRKTVVLSDGTSVQMNSSSILLYPEKFTGSKRQVFLVGEADFKVAKDARHPFVVSLGAMDVTALGTEFNISSYPEDRHTIATLIEGSIMVECGENKENVYILEPGKQLVYEKDKAAGTVTDADMEAVTAWQEGLLLFRSVTLDEVAKALQRKFGMHFIPDSDLGDDKYNFKFREDAALKDVLEIMSAVVKGLDYSIDEASGVCRLSIEDEN